MFCEHCTRRLGNRPLVIDRWARVVQSLMPCTLQTHFPGSRKRLSAPSEVSNFGGRGPRASSVGRRASGCERMRDKEHTRTHPQRNTSSLGVYTVYSQYGGLSRTESAGRESRLKNVGTHARFLHLQPNRGSGPGCMYAVVRWRACVHVHRACATTVDGALVWHNYLWGRAAWYSRGGHVGGCRGTLCAIVSNSLFMSPCALKALCVRVGTACSVSRAGTAIAAS